MDIRKQVLKEQEEALKRKIAYGEISQLLEGKTDEKKLAIIQNEISKIEK